MRLAARLAMARKRAGQLGQALNEAIASLPQQEEHIKKVEIIDIQS